MLQKLSKLWRPDVFQGADKKGHYFEGWFYKIVNADGAHTYAFIPGVYLDKNSKNSHAFVMVLDAEKHLSSYHVYSLQEFQSSAKRLDIQVGPNRFNSDYFEIHIDSRERSVHGRITLGDFNPWPITLFSPGVMGWYAFVPFMQCYHGLISFDHAIDGRLTINNQDIRFAGGRGYIEKDWGQSFPSAYVWMQSNHFDTRGVSLMASVANIPWLHRSFRGFIIGLRMNDKLLRFTTYTRAALELCDITEKFVRIIVSDKKYRLAITAARTDGAVLFAPYDLKMTPRVSETLGSNLQVDLYKKSTTGEKLLFSEIGKHAGLDVHGHLVEIIC